MKGAGLERAAVAGKRKMAGNQRMGDDLSASIVGAGETGNQYKKSKLYLKSSTT